MRDSSRFEVDVKREELTKQVISAVRNLIDLMPHHIWKCRICKWERPLHSCYDPLSHYPGKCDLQDILCPALQICWSCELAMAKGEEKLIIKKDGSIDTKP